MSSANVSSGLQLGDRVPELDGLRGVAILLVILCHYVGMAEHARLGLWTHRLLSAFSAGWSGVDLFFVLSGFLIGGILLDARDSPLYFRTFYTRRVLRILPVYHGWIFLYVVIIGVATWFTRGASGLKTSDLGQVPIQLLFLQNMRFGMAHFPWIWFAVTWSLAVEEQFYLVAPPLIRFLSTRKMVAVLLATICAAPVLRLLTFRYSLFNLMPCRADALGLGILIAIAWRTDWVRGWLERHPTTLKRTLYALFVGVGLLLWWLAHPAGLVTVTIGLSWLALFYGCVLLAAISQTPNWLAGVLRLAVLRRLGTISYCVYIIHLTIDELAHQFLLGRPPRVDDAAGIAVTVLALVATLGVASISWRFFEKPLVRYGHRASYETPVATRGIPVGTMETAGGTGA
jgi:peptidoglycan/LPS O-acetylase OafA/YrhL